MSKKPIYFYYYFFSNAFSVLDTNYNNTMYGTKNAIIETTVTKTKSSKTPNYSKNIVILKINNSLFTQ